MLAPSLGIDYENDLLCREMTDAKRLLMDVKFGYSHGLHEPIKLLLLGFMYCKYESLPQHLENLWHLINPNFKSKVSIRVIRSTLEDLLYIAIDQRLEMLRSDQECDPLQKAFLEDCHETKDYCIERTCAKLQENDESVTHVTRARFMEVIDSKYCRLSSLR